LATLLLFGSQSLPVNAGDALDESVRVRSLGLIVEHPDALAMGAQCARARRAM